MNACPVTTPEAVACAEQATETLLLAMESASWFAAVAAPPTPGEEAELAAYLEASGQAPLRVHWIAGWDEARTLLLGADWDRASWQSAQDERDRLMAELKQALGEQETMRILTRVTDLAARLLHGPAAVAAARDRVADPGLVRVAAGSAAEACYHMALVRLAGAGEDHAFACRFRLFEAGRWPLVAVGGTYCIF